MTDPPEGRNTGPVAETARIDAIDVLRGVALLGILLMNVQSFSMPQAAYFNPTAYGDLEGANLYVWVAGRMLADQKFMTIFSMLFGAGICTTIFYGHGLGWFGSVDRVGQIGVVAAVWAVQLVASPLWLRRFRFGPAEWAWR